MPLVAIVIYVCLFSGLGVLGLVGPDEPRYAAIARAMAATNDWITPRLWGSPWFEKPVLYYWTAGAAMRILGVSSFAARLPSALTALLAVLAAAWAALRTYGIAASWYVLLMLPASVALIGFSRAASTDMLFAGILTAAMAVGSQMLQQSRPTAFQRVAFGFFLGAAVLAKGPAAVILAGAATLIWALLVGRWRSSFLFLHPLVVLTFCVIALPWYVLCALRNPDFLRVFLWQHNFERYTTPIFEHQQPFWFYGYILALAVLPWIAFFISGLIAGVKGFSTKPKPESADIFFACWAVFPVLFFSISESKLPGYILPAIPPVFILLARWWSKSLSSARPGPTAAAAATGVLLILAPIVGFAGAEGGLPKMFPADYLVLAVVALVCGAALLMFSAQRRVSGVASVISVLAVAGVLIANWGVLPKLDRQISARHIAALALMADPSGDNIVLYDVPRDLNYGMDYYLNRELPVWKPQMSEPEWIVGPSLPDPRWAGDYEAQGKPVYFEFHKVVYLYRRK